MLEGGSQISRDHLGGTVFNHVTRDKVNELTILQ
jgi:hypothetical protein